uniref:Uncharacterized protein n=1 Tax=Romanomermis culicivorax TaxID=13658 RepID=A0A915I9E8_ROMCU
MEPAASTSTSAVSTTNQSLVTLTPSSNLTLSTDAKLKRKVDVLDEDEYIEKLEKIIQRDYFPDIAKLKAQNEYFDAIRNNDQVRIKQLQERFSSRRTDKTMNTPRSPHEFFETPIAEKDNEIAWEEDLVAKNNEREDKKIEKEDAEGIDKLTIDKFLYKFTSEDNASFEEILEESELKLREKHSWMYNAESEHDKKFQDSLHLKQADEQLLAITEGESTSSQMLKRNRKRASVDNWTYKALNAVMFTPDDVALTSEELVERHKMKQREILSRNTRLPPDSLTRTASGGLSIPATLRAVVNKGKVDAQGNELYVNKDKYSFVVTPSPAPGVNESPLMTWGEIEGTPFRLDAADTIVPHTPGPTFKIPDIPIRDELALKMAGEATRKAKEKRNSAVNDLKKLTPKFGSARSVERMDCMSPAAKRLASTKLGIRLGTDKSLKASYTPSPARSISAKSPLVSYDTPNYQETPKEGPSVVTSSLTDNLLNISTHKPKATDYF